MTDWIISENLKKNQCNLSKNKYQEKTIHMLEVTDT